MKAWPLEGRASFHTTLVRDEESWLGTSTDLQPCVLSRIYQGLVWIR